MNLEQRISSFSRLGEILRSFTGERSNTSVEHQLSSGIEAIMQTAMEKAERENTWFTRDNILLAFNYWGNMLDQPILENWLVKYTPKTREKADPKRVGVIMAGNIPMVGFHDMLSVLLSGNHLIAKLSSQDASLIPALIQVLKRLEPSWANRIEITTGEINKPEAIIATGSNNTSRYFNYYFGKYPHIIRKNRTGVAILDGEESTTELQGFASDIFSYFGLGCRNVSKLYLPEGYDIKPLHEAFLQYQDLFHHPKYRNNLDYYKSIYMVNRTRFLDGIFYLLVEAEPLTTPVSILHFEYYRDLSLVEATLDQQREQIQCVVSRKSLVKPGETQNPALSDYADGVDTMEFLMEKI